MAAESTWRRWRREVHDILEVGGDAHPAGRFINAFIVVLIFLNAIAFAVETVDHLADRYGRYFDAFNVFWWRCSASNICCGCGARSTFRC